MWTLWSTRKIQNKQILLDYCKSIGQRKNLLTMMGRDRHACPPRLAVSLSVQNTACDGMSGYGITAKGGCHLGHLEVKICDPWLWRLEELAFTLNVVT